MKKNVGYRVQLIPIACRIDENGRELRIDEDWIIDHVSEAGIRISNDSGYFTTLGGDHIHHFTSNPDRSRGGISYGFLTLHVQIFFQGGRLWIHPTTRPGEPVKPPNVEQKLEGESNNPKKSRLWQRMAIVGLILAASAFFVWITLRAPGTQSAKSDAAQKQTPPSTLQLESPPPTVAQPEPKKTRPITRPEETKDEKFLTGDPNNPPYFDFVNIQNNEAEAVLVNPSKKYSAFAVNTSLRTPHIPDAAFARFSEPREIPPGGTVLLRKHPLRTVIDSGQDWKSRKITYLRYEIRIFTRAGPYDEQFMLVWLPDKWFLPETNIKVPVPNGGQWVRALRVLRSGKLTNPLRELIHPNFPVDGKGKFEWSGFSEPDS